MIQNSTYIIKRESEQKQKGKTMRDKNGSEITSKPNTLKYKFKNSNQIILILID